MSLHHVTVIMLIYAVTCQKIPVNPNQVCIIVPQDVEECFRQFDGKPISEKAAQVNCLLKLLWNYIPDTNLTTSDFEYFRQLAGDFAGALPLTGAPVGHRSKFLQPPTGRRARKEYRLLTDRERLNFHEALQKLYKDGTIRVFALLHAKAYEAHYLGASFLPWIRIYLLMFEEALRHHDASISLPYWDSTIDNDMDNPVNSGLWTPEYFGNGAGEVTSGFAANWTTIQGNLERNYGQRSRLLSKTHIRQILSKCYLQDISKPTAMKDNDLEKLSAGPLVWVGGDVSSASTSGFDPIFYMHLAFVDYVWELFRRRQQRFCGVDPATDYPVIPVGNSHASDSTMTGFEWLRNIDGIQQQWIDNWYYYESTPSCPDCCAGCSFPASMYCDNRKRVCVARSRRNIVNDRRDSPHISFAALAQSIHLEPYEQEALELQLPPRNRGQEFDALLNDGRTLRTAIADTLAQMSQLERLHSSTRSTADDRGSIPSISRSLPERRSGSIDRDLSGGRSQPVPPDRSTRRILSAGNAADPRRINRRIRSDIDTDNIHSDSRSLRPPISIPDPRGHQEQRFFSEFPQSVMRDIPTSFRGGHSDIGPLTDTRDTTPRRLRSGRTSLAIPERQRIPNEVLSNTQRTSASGLVPYVRRTFSSGFLDRTGAGQNDKTSIDMTSIGMRAKRPRTQFL